MKFWQNDFVMKMNLTALTILAAGILAAGCASTPSPSTESATTPPPPPQYVPPQPALSADEMAKLCQQAPDTCHRVQMAQPLTFSDVKVLAKLPVSSDAIIAQVKTSHTVYHLTSTNIIDLKSSGVSDQVIDFLISTPSSIAGSMPVPEPQTNAPSAQSPPPAPPDDPQPPAPAPDYVWVGGDWVWNGGWVWVGGHWVYPPYPGAVWLHGGWVHGGFWGGAGYHRFRGHWR
jgi:hypothetical protein